MEDTNPPVSGGINNDSDDQKEKETEAGDVEKLEIQVKELEQKSEEYLNGWKRAKADFINYKKEQEQAFSEFVKFANQSLILQILPVLDNFNLAIKHLPEDLKDNEWVKGISHIKTQLEDIMKNQGLEEIKVVKGELLNPQLHEVIGGRVGGDFITEEVRKGYKLNDKVIRVTQVKVEVRNFQI